MNLPIIIGDVHGEYNSLVRLVDSLPHDNLCFLGDLIDRGLKSKQVVEFVKNNNYQCVMGNHENFMERSCDENFNWDKDWLGAWQENGGKNTLLSYLKNGKLDKDLFLEDRLWMENLPITIKFNSNHNDFESIIASHGRCLPFIDKGMFKYDIIWYKSRKLDHNQCNILNVHGHQTTYNIEIKDNYLNIDTGSNSCGILTACDLNDMVVYQYVRDRSSLEKFNLL